MTSPVEGAGVRPISDVVIARGGKVVLQNLGLAFAVVPTLVFALRALGVARFDVDKAEAVLVNTSLSDAIRSTALPLLQLTAVLVAFAVLWTACESAAVHGPWQIGTFLRFLVVLPFAALSWILDRTRGENGLELVLGGVVFWALFLAFTWYLTRIDSQLLRADPVEYEKSRRKSGLGFLVGVAVGATLSFVPTVVGDHMWRPLESFQSKVAQESLCGYLLAVSDDYLVILDDVDRTVRELSRSSVLNRSIVRPDDTCSIP